MKRGDLVTVSLQGDYGKPRPAVVIQSDLFSEHNSVTVLPVTSDLRDAPMLRLTIMPSPGNGLRKTSQVMVDKTMTVPREKAGAPFGRLTDVEMLAITRALAVFFGFA